MNDDTKQPQRPAWQTLRDRYVDRAFAEEILETAGTVPADGRVAPSVLFAAASGAVAMPDDLRACLVRDSAVRAQFLDMVERTSAYTFPQLRAASTAKVSRIASGCRLRLQESAAEPDQLFVIVELDDPDAMIQRIVLSAEDRAPVIVPLPPPHRGVCQVIVERDGEAAALWGDV